MQAIERIKFEARNPKFETISNDKSTKLKMKKWLEI